MSFSIISTIFLTCF